MDGIGSKEGVLMLASTNRADILDKVYNNFVRNVVDYYSPCSML